MKLIILIIVISFIIYTIKKKNRNKSFIKNRIKEFFHSQNQNGEYLQEVQNLINRKYTPRSKVELEIYPDKKRGYKIGEKLIPIFKTKESYYQEYQFQVCFKYKNNLIAIEDEFINDKHLLIRLIRAHFSGYTPIVTIEKVTKGLYLDVSVEFEKDGKIIGGKIQRKKSTKNRGKFTINGYHHLSDEIKLIVWKKLKVGDHLNLIPDERNSFDNYAVKVFFEGKQIGWIPKKYSRKELIYNSLLEGKEIVSICIKNKRDQDYVGNNWKNKYLGMAQFVEVKYEFEK
jgi:hypothetical protein